jgi:hypothetical protein
MKQKWGIQSTVCDEWMSMFKGIMLTWNTEEEASMFLKLRIKETRWKVKKLPITTESKK